MEKYESPKMKFESVTLFEKIANPCWAKKTLHVDVPDTEDDIIITLRQSINPSGEPNSGCGDLVIDCIKTEVTGSTMPLPELFNENTSKNFANTQMACISGS
jgi:hypothetical protein